MHIKKYQIKCNTCHVVGLYSLPPCPAPNHFWPPSSKCLCAASVSSPRGRTQAGHRQDTGRKGAEAYRMYPPMYLRVIMVSCEHVRVVIGSISIPELYYLRSQLRINQASTKQAPSKHQTSTKQAPDPPPSLLSPLSHPRPPSNCSQF